jgi:dethiobiotin synthetase
VEALKKRGIPLLGIAFVGDEMADSQETIGAFSGTKILGRLPCLDPLTPDALAAAFSAAFDLADFAPKRAGT